MAQRSLLAIFAAAVSACGGSVNEAPGQPGAGGGGGGGGQAGAGGQGAACALSSDGLSISVQSSENPLPAGCPKSWKQTGRVTGTAPNSVTLDTCAPDAGCTGIASVVALEAPGLSFALPKGAFVTVQVERSWGFGYCPTWISVVNEPTWGGEQNPVSKEPLVYFLGTEKHLDNPNAPFTVTKQAVSCADSVAHYQLVFAGPDGTSHSLAMGQQATVLGPAPFLVRNQRSYQLNAADAPPEMSWWAVAAALVK